MVEDVNFDATETKTLLIQMTMAGICLILILAVITTFIKASKRTGNVILPGGVTYLGEQKSEVKSQKSEEMKDTKTQTVFTAEKNTPWVTLTGKKYLYSLSVPKTLTTTTFPGDANDSIAITWGGNVPENNILVSVINLSTDKNLSGYSTKPKKVLVENWWKQFSGLSGVATSSAFTNTSGLKGYRAKYINTLGQTPNLDIFFEVPGVNNLMIRIANGILDPAVFEKIVQSVRWK